ncbi:heterokaryon incompatibility protein-domain-containing protein [Astrocystis sublimbata]|nr:heterokaryon incompatibility protein-domain-containing protein [Astrocystis sublimbata]
MARIQGWINACVANHSHPGCGNELEMLLPKGVRMLEIEDHRQAKVRLIENLPKAKFAALSHRWGPKTETASLKQANLNEFQKQVPRSSLYELLRDAIQVAGEIGLRYIWIDCLCIIQDNLKDWNYQSGQMASIYAGAFITISGTGFIDDDKGLFRDSPIAANIIIAENVPCPLYLGPRLQHPYIGTYGPGPHRMELTPEDYPLAGRGWVYQERVLSKRILHFTSQEVIWECLGKPQCECGWLDYRDLCHQSDILDLPWIEIVTQYSRMHLTEKTDRLPAIAGIAKSYADLHSRTYLAGLWEETLAGDLLWLAGDQLRLSQMPGPTYTPESLGPRDRPLVAPTWSWASAKPLRSLSRWPPPSLSTHVILEKYDFEHEPGGDSYSQPVRAHLHVEGPVIFGTLKDGYFEHGVYFRMQFKDKTAVFMPDYDITAAGDDHIEFGATLPFLLLMGDGEGGAFGIVLHGKKEDGIMNYERIGIIAIQGEEPLQCSWVLERSTRMKLILV